MSIQWIREEPGPALVVVPLATAVARGDIVGMTSNSLVKASAETWVTNEATTQANFVARFTGIAAQKKDANALTYGNQGAGDIRVDTAGVFRMPLKAGSTAAVGNFIGPASNGSSLLYDQIVDVVATEARSIGECVGIPLGANGAEIEVRIHSTLLSLARKA